MEINGMPKGKILIVSAIESFLAKGLVSKMSSEGLEAVLVHGKIKEIDEYREETELVIIFMGEGMDEMTDTFVYLKDLASDLDKKIIVIGDEPEYDIVRKTIPESLIMEWFKRPLVTDDLMKSVTRYMAENTGENAKKTVLIVDDDITYMRTVYEWLKDTYHVGMASNGVQAISYLARNKADLILLDYEMPVVNGPQVLEMLESDSETGRVPVMFLTGRGDKESVLSVVGLKPADYLLKTIDRPTLLKKLNDFFKAN